MLHSERIGEESRWEGGREGGREGGGEVQVTKWNLSET